MSALIFLTGMPAAGKTCYAAQWADASGYLHVDLDAVVEQAAGKTISGIFAEEGEAAFRHKERDALREIVATVQGNAIISCGGGTPVFFDNQDYMKAQGCVVYLRATVDELLINLRKEPHKRPLISGKDAKDTLEALMAERAPFYEQAHHIIDVKTITGSTFAEILALCTNRHL